GMEPYQPRPPSERLRTWRDRVRAAASGQPTTPQPTAQLPPHGATLPGAVREQILSRVGKGKKL
ncbi:MAG: hypothetical protein ACE5H2_10235, partial [Terriglobia bacterium]